MTPLVSTKWLASEIGASDLRIVDATLFLPDSGRDAGAEYGTEHIPGALFLDLDELRDTASPLPNMLPSPEKFASRMRGLGLGDGSRIVLYDNSPLHSAARAWWMFRMYTNCAVAILDGGLAKWKAEGRATERGNPEFRRRHFTVTRNGALLRDKAQMLAALNDGVTTIVDARGAPRFAGEEAEPRADITPGHMPGAINLPYAQMFNPDGSWKQGDELKAAFEGAGIDLTKPMVTTCGSGVTAAVVMFGAHLLGKQDVALYDGSWAEWGADAALPKATGRA